MAVTYDPIVEAYKKKDKAIDAQVQANGAAYDAQRADAADKTTATLQDLYLQNERAKLTRKQANKAAGLTGGAVESAEIAARSNYMTNRTNAMLARDKQLSDIDIAQRQAAGQAEMEKAQNAVELETGRLSFNQTERSFEQEKNTQRRSELWEMVRAGVVTDKIAKELGWGSDVLKRIAKRYEEA